VAEHLVVEHRFVDRNRQGFLGAEADRVRKLLLAVYPADVERPDTDAVVGNSEPDTAPRQLVLREELLQRGGEGVGISELAADDDACGKRVTRDAWLPWRRRARP
jgi:hypothetical protein